MCLASVGFFPGLDKGFLTAQLNRLNCTSNKFVRSAIISQFVNSILRKNHQNYYLHSVYNFIGFCRFDHSSGGDCKSVVDIKGSSKRETPVLMPGWSNGEQNLSLQ